MSLTVSDRIRLIIDPQPFRTVAPARPPIEPLQSLPILIGWILGPPAPMPRRRAMVEGELQVVASPADSQAHGSRV